MSVRLKALATLVTDQGTRGTRPFIALEHVEGGTGRVGINDDHPLREEADAGSAVVEGGDVLFGKLRPYLAKTWRVDRPVYASTELMALRPTSDADSAWLGYLVASRPVVEWAVATSDGTKMPRTSWEKLANFLIDHVPSVAEQRAIADFLDRETARIDALITVKRRMMELAWKRYVGAIDAHSAAMPRVVALKRVARISYGLGQPPPLVEQGVPIIRATNISRGVVTRDQMIYAADESLPWDRCPPLRAGELLVVRSGALTGDSAIVTHEWAGASPGYDLRVTPQGVCAEFLAHQFLGTTVTDQIHLAKGRAAQPHLNAEDLGDIGIRVGSIEHEQATAEKLTRLRDGADSLTHALTRQIELLVEHRQALITAAVTGELSIPGVAA